MKKKIIFLLLAVFTIVLSMLVSCSKEGNGISVSEIETKFEVVLEQKGEEYSYTKGDESYLCVAKSNDDISLFKYSRTSTSGLCQELSKSSILDSFSRFNTLGSLYYHTGNEIDAMNFVMSCGEMIILVSGDKFENAKFDDVYDISIGVIAEGNVYSANGWTVSAEISNDEVSVTMKKQ